jgi:hypothetical protein
VEGLGFSTDLVILVPLVTCVQELVAVRALVAAAAATTHVRLRVGAMIETPRAALVAGALITEADVLCIGSNDLTQFTWAADRVHARRWTEPYVASQMLDSDPFEQVDHTVVQLISHAVHSARTIKADAPILVCGDHASHVDSVRDLFAAGATAVSCRVDAVRSIRESLPLRQVANWPSDVLLNTSGAVVRARECLRRIQTAIEGGRVASAQSHALSWAMDVCVALSLPEVTNWKFFKRDIAAIWFGQREFRRYLSNWRPEDVVNVVTRWMEKGATVRYSVFPPDIACHAVSGTFPTGPDQTAIVSLLQGLDATLPLEVFPQQPVERLCFRIASNDVSCLIEAGQGQAMYVFETERGSHATAQADLRALFLSGTCPVSGPAAIAARLEDMLSRYGATLLAGVIDMAATLGVPWFAIEGYYDSDAAAFPVVCDIDLPQDLAFHVRT